MGDMKWYVLRTAGTKEKKAKDYLEKEIERSGLVSSVGHVLVPVKNEIVIKNGKRKQVERLLFPGYVFIQADLNPELEYIIRNLVPGMSGFLTEKKEMGKGSNQIERVPVPLRDSEVASLFPDEPAQEETLDTVVDYQIGDAVKITDGAFNGFSGTVEEILEDRSKLKVVVVIFGRKTLLELGFAQVTKE